MDFWRNGRLAKDEDSWFRDKTNNLRNLTLKWYVVIVNYNNIQLFCTTRNLPLLRISNANGVNATNNWWFLVSRLSIHLQSLNTGVWMDMYVNKSLNSVCKIESCLAWPLTSIFIYFHFCTTCAFIQIEYAGTEMEVLKELAIIMNFNFDIVSSTRSTLLCNPLKQQFLFTVI